jgi:hypothetical protein
MTGADSASSGPVIPGKERGRAKLVIVIAVTVAVTLGAVWLVRTYLFPSAFRPVELSVREQQRVDEKLEQLGVGGVYGATETSAADAPLEPEPYSEDDDRRVIAFTEKELNGLIAHNTGLASRLAIDLADNLASAKLLLPMDEGFPVLGGRTKRIDAGLELGFANNQPVVALRGVSIMGVPVPNAWMGNLRNVDLVREFGGERGFWDRVAAGVESLELRDGELRIRLRE